MVRLYPTVTTIKGRGFNEQRRPAPFILPQGRALMQPKPVTSRVGKCRVRHMYANVCICGQM